MPRTPPVPVSNIGMFSISNRLRQYTQFRAPPIIPQQFETLTNLPRTKRTPSSLTFAESFKRYTPPIISSPNGTPQLEVARRSFSEISHATAPKRAISQPPDASEPKASKLKDKTKPITDHELFFVHCSLCY
jgi:hypothetical protein